MYMYTGVFSIEELRLAGVGRGELRKRLLAGELISLARGWYAAADADPRVVAAAENGVKISCVTVCEMNDLWVPTASSGSVHVLAGRGVAVNQIAANMSARLKDSKIQTHRAQQALALAKLERTRFKVRNSVVDSLGGALECAVRFHDSETAQVLLESALNKRLVSMAGVEEVLERVPSWRSRRIHSVSALSESGSETRVAHFFRARNVQVRQQVQVNRWLRADILVGRSWIVECDSRAFHSLGKDYELDRRRDLELQRLGYRVTRLSYHQIWSDWENTKAALSAVLRRRQHARPPRP